MMVTSNKQDILREIEDLFGAVPTWIDEVPDQALAGFWSLMKEFHLGETKIPNKYKELIGVAVAGATRCRYCALFHTEAAKLFGATEEEIAEAGMVSGFSSCASTFLNASQADYDTFRKETLTAIEHVRAQLEAQSKPAKRASA